MENIFEETNQLDKDVSAILGQGNDDLTSFWLEEMLIETIKFND